MPIELVILASAARNCARMAKMTMNTYLVSELETWAYLLMLILAPVYCCGIEDGVSKFVFDVHHLFSEAL